MSNVSDRLERGSTAIAVIAWLVLHIALLWVIYFDLPITTKEGFNGRSLGLSLVLIAEMAAATLFFAGLTATNSDALFTFAMVFASVQLAGNLWLSAKSIDVAMCLAKAASWLAVLRLLCVVIPRRHMLATSIILSLYTFGTTLVWYCLQEFGGIESTTTIMWYASPLLNATSQVFWLHVAGLAILALLVRLLHGKVTI